MSDGHVTNEDLAAQIMVNTTELRRNTQETRQIAERVKEQNSRIGKLEQWQSYSTGRRDAEKAVRDGRAWVYPAIVSMAGGFVTAMSASLVGAVIWLFFIK